MGRNHARVLSGLAGVDLVGIVDPAGDQHGAIRGVPILPTVTELIGLGIDYAVVACPTALHEAFEAKSLVAGVGHIERYNPSLQSLRSRLEAGELGDVYQVVTRRQGPFPHRIADVGVVMDLATHDIDLTSWVTGQPYAAVSARTVSRSGRPHEDMVAAVCQLANGTMVSHLVNWLSPLKERSTVVTGDRGCFVADTLTADLTFYANAAIDTEWEALRAFRGVAEGDMIRFAIPKREPLLVEHERFRDAVEGKESDIVTLRQGLRTVEVSAAVLDSATRGVTV